MSRRVRRNTVANLHQAVRFGRSNDVRRLLKKATVREVNTRDQNYGGATMLLHAACLDNLEIVQCLLGAKAAVNQAKNNGATPLSISAQQNHLNIVKCFIEAKAVVNQARNDGCTPLFISAQFGHLNIVKCLLGAKAAVNQA